MNQLFKKSGLAAILAGFAMSNLSAAPVAEIDASGINSAAMDKSVRIQDDLFGHINGTWLKNTPIPADKPMWGSFVELDDSVQPQLHGIIDHIRPDVADGSEAQKIRDMYASYMDTATIEALGIKPLAPLFAKIDALTDKAQLPAFIAYLNRVGITAPFDSGVSPDEKDSTQYAVHFGQAGLGLPDRDYYLNDDDAKLNGLREGYQKHIEKMLTMAGDSNAAASAQTILTLETALAKIQWTKVELRDPVKAYNKIATADLNALTPGFDFQAYLNAMGVSGKIRSVIVGQPDYLTGFAKVLQDLPLESWKTYFKWHALSSNASLLPANFADERFAFYGTALQGVPEQKPRWNRGVDKVNAILGEAMGKLYVTEYFPAEHKERMERLVANLMAAYRTSIDRLDWMSPATKKQAQLKLSTMVTKIGYPDKWRDYAGLTISRGDLIGNIQRANEFESAYEISRLGKPIDRQQWGMTPQTVNAQYDPQFNDITFPAAILRPPFFNPEADDAVNYGAIGAVIGHEISHAFDDEGSQYDEKGNLRNWWTDQDHEKFAKKTAALVKQYNRFSPLQGYNVNGELTLGENIADNSGLAIAMKAYKISLHGKPAPKRNGYTGEQRFYIGFAQVWQMKARDEFALVLLKTDPHSPVLARTNGTVQNQPEFYKAFNVKPGDKLYLAPKERVIIW